MALAALVNVKRRRGGGSCGSVTGALGFAGVSRAPDGAFGKVHDAEGLST